MIRLFLLSAKIAFILISCICNAQDYERVSTRKWALSTKLGTIGPGLEMVKYLSPKINSRLGATYLPFSKELRDNTKETITDVGVRMATISLLTDFHLSEFYLSTGVYFNFSELSLEGQSSRSYKINEYLIEPDELGVISSTITPALVCPYIGFGWDSYFKEDSPYSLEFGVFYHGVPKVTLDATGYVSPSVSQKSMMEDKLKNQRYYIIVSFHLFKIFK